MSQQVAEMKVGIEPKSLTLWFLKLLEYLFCVVMSSGPYINPTNQAPWEQRPRVWCRPILTCGPKGMVDMIYIVNHYVLLHTKYRSHFKRFFKRYSPVSLWKLKTLRV